MNIFGSDEDKDADGDNDDEIFFLFSFCKQLIITSNEDNDDNHNGYWVIELKDQE